MEQLIILVLIVVISAVNWLLQRSAELREKRKAEKARTASGGDHSYGQPASLPEPEPRPMPRQPADELREIMEALGIPVEVPPSTVPEPPPLPEPERVAPPVVAPQEPVRAPVRRAPVLSEAADVPSGRPWIQDALRSREDVRRAIVLREVLGPAKAWTS